MDKECRFNGTGISNGKVSGKIRFLDEKERLKTEDTVTDKNVELKRFKEAQKTAVSEVKELAEKTRLTLGQDEAEIFDIHAMLLQDEDFIEEIIKRIEGGEGAAKATELVAKAQADLLLSLNDEYLSARATDIKDISGQIIRILVGDVDENQRNDCEPYILVAPDLTPSQTVSLDKERILGFVTFGGTPSSHTAILARAMGIPALVGTGAIDKSLNGAFALLNAENGTLVVSPSKDEIAEFERKRGEYNKIAKEHESYLRSVMNKPAVTGSGHKVMVYANIGDESEVAPALSNGAEGIGLLRSEFLYISQNDYPGEEELFESYRDVAIKMQGKRVIVRTLDVGADKQIPYFNIPREENPALGYRGIRVCLDRIETFKSQLRAILRASYFGRVALMLPMIVSAEEIKRTKALLEECKRELSTRGEKFDSQIELGIMIETPASAVMSEELAPLVDFFSVGTNDLAQYTLAADRQNAMVSKICEKNVEPVMRLIKMSADAIHQKGGWIGVCGEMAADLSLTQRFVDMEIDELSVSVPYLLGVRGKISECR